MVKYNLIVLVAVRTKAEFASDEVGPPAAGSMAYMLSKRQYIHDPSPAQGPANWHPHVMFFVCATDGSPWGANVPGGPLFSATSDAEPVTTYFLVVPDWSDGTPGPVLTPSGIPGYSSRSPSVTGMRAARTAGKSPPRKPIARAHFSPPATSAGVTRNSNTTWLKFAPRVEAV